MKYKIYAGTATLLLFMAVLTYHNMLWNVIGGIILAVFFCYLFGLSSGVAYTESHYRIYTRILCWKSGHWKSIRGIKRMGIRHDPPVHRNFFQRFFDELRGPEQGQCKLYFVRKSGKYIIFSSHDALEVQEQAQTLARRYNLKVIEKDSA